MPLPRSTFVMGVAVAGVLGLAIRGTANREHTATPDEEEAAERDAMRREAAARDKQIEAHEADARAATAKRDTARAEGKKLIGAEVATFGGPLAGYSLPAATAQMQSAADALETSIAGKVSLLHFGQSGAVDRVEITPYANDEPLRRDACAALERELATAWGSGRPMVGDADSQVWLNPGRRMRTAFASHAEGCHLFFEHVLAVDAWLQRSAVVGKRATEVPDYPTSLDDEPADERSWADAGVGAGAGPTTFTARVAGGRVVEVTARTVGDDDTFRAIADVLTKQLGKPAGTADRLKWSSIELDRFGGQIVVTRGAKK